MAVEITAYSKAEMDTLLAGKAAALDLTAASAAVAGIVELATSEETVTGDDATRATTPAGVKAALDAKSVSDMSTYVALGSARTAPAPLLTAVPITAETVTVSASGYNAATGTFYGTSAASGHYMTSADLDSWTDRTYSPSVYTAGGGVREFDETYMYAYSTSNGRVFRAPLDVFNDWTEISPAFGPLTTGRVGSLCALGSGVLLYGNYTSASGDGAHIWRSTDAGATWTEVLTVAHPDGKHVHAIRLSPTTGYVWASVGDAGFAGLGLYRSTDDGLTWEHVSSNNYGIDMVFLPAAGPWPDLVALEGDGLNRPHVMAFPEDAPAGTDTFPLVWGWSGPTTDALSWRGTTRGIAVLTGGHLLYYTTTESGAVGVRAGVWVAEAPDYQRVILLRETTGAEPFYGTTFHTATYVQNAQRRYAAPAFGSY